MKQKSLARRALALGVLTVGVALLDANVALAQEPAQEAGGPSSENRGQSTSPPAPVQGLTPRLWGISAMGGAAVIDLGPLNDRLSTSYGAKLPMTFPLLGGQGFGLFSHFLIGGSGAAFIERSMDLPNAREANASGAWGTVDFGYQLVRVGGFLLVPMVSAGGYGMTIGLSPKSAGSFNDVLANPARATTLTNKGGLGGVAVLAKVIVVGRSAGVDNARSGLAIGLRVGGLYGFPIRDWEADGASVSGGPKFGLRGGYAALSLGAGSW